MTQISRPFQIALAVVALLGAVWVVALRGHSNSSTPSRSAAPAAKASGGDAAGKPSKIYHGPAPGVEGLTRAVDKAHGAVATSQRNAKELAEKSAQASSAHPPASSSSSSSASATKVTGGTQARTSTHAASKPTTHKGSASAGTRHVGVPARQHAVESELRRGRVVVILFWNKKAADDRVVRQELQLLAKAHREGRAPRFKSEAGKAEKLLGLEFTKPIAVHYASQHEVASFGSFTRNVQVFGTPTLLVVGKRGKTLTLTGLQDAYSIEQTIDEVRHSQG